MASLIGQSVPRVEDDALLRGRGRFLDDIKLPGLSHVCFLRSEHADALKSIRDSKQLDDDNAAKLKNALTEFGKTFA